MSTTASEHDVDFKLVNIKAGGVYKPVGSWQVGNESSIRGKALWLLLSLRLSEPLELACEVHLIGNGNELEQRWKWDRRWSRSDTHKSRL